MRKVSYDYCNENLLEHPKKYQMSPFFGSEFLNSYKSFRKNILNMVDYTSSYTNILDLLPTNFFDSIQPLSASHIVTVEVLKEELHKILTSKFSFSEKMNKLLKKFEITKKIFSEYDFEFKNNFGQHNNLLNYLLLSTICLHIYEHSKNLKFFNSSLKLNDILCSQNIENYVDMEKKLLHYVITKELNLVNELCSIKGIKQ